MTMQTGVTQSFRQRTAKSVSATDVKTEFCYVRLQTSIMSRGYFNSWRKSCEFQKEKNYLRLRLPRPISCFYDEGSNPSRIEPWEEYGDPQMQKLRESWERIHPHWKFGDGKFCGDIEREYDWLQIIVLDRVCSGTWSSQEVVKGKGTSLLWLGRMTCSREEAKEKWSSLVDEFKTSSKTEAKARWSSKVEEFQMYCAVDEFLGIDLEAIEFEWNVFPGFTTLQILQEIQKDLQCQNVEPERFSGRIIFMPMFNDIEWEKRGIEGMCINNSEQANNSEQVKSFAQRFPRGHWAFVRPVDEMKLVWYPKLQTWWKVEFRSRKDAE